MKLDGKCYTTRLLIVISKKIGKMSKGEKEIFVQRKIFLPALKQNGTLAVCSTTNRPLPKLKF